MVQKKEVEVDLHQRMHKKIIHAKQRNHISDKEIYALSKEFFSELLKLDYEFTHEELIDELQKTYLEKKDLEQTIAFIKKVGVMEFTSNEYNQEELKTMLDELQTILNRLIQEKKELGWFARLKQKFFKPKTTTNTPEQITASGKEGVLIRLLEQIKKEPEGKQKQELYKQAIITYELLSEEAKVSFYNDLLGMYYQLQHQEIPEQEELVVKEKNTIDTNLHTPETEQQKESDQNQVEKTSSKKETKEKIIEPETLDTVLDSLDEKDKQKKETS